jgi:hypothetical protein
MSVTVHDAVEAARRVLEERGESDQIVDMELAYAVIATEPLSRVRVPSTLHVAPLMQEIGGDESLDVATHNVLKTLYFRFASTLRVASTHAVRSMEPDYEPGVPIDHDGFTYRMDGDNVLHFEVRNENNLLIHALHIKVAAAADGEPPVVASPGLRTGRHPAPDDHEREHAWREAREAVTVAWELGLYEGRTL